jgi:hypothetical protein
LDDGDLTSSDSVSDLSVPVRAGASAISFPLGSTVTADIFSYGTAYADYHAIASASPSSFSSPSTAEDLCITSGICACQPGYTLKSNVCTPIEKCAATPYACDDPLEICNSARQCQLCPEGSFPDSTNTVCLNKCSPSAPCASSEYCGLDGLCTQCPTGLEVTVDMTCVDIDECLSSNPCKSGTCQNFFGGYTCLDPFEVIIWKGVARAYPNFLQVFSSRIGNGEQSFDMNLWLPWIQHAFRLGQSSLLGLRRKALNLESYASALTFLADKVRTVSDQSKVNFLLSHVDISNGDDMDLNVIFKLSAVIKSNSFPNNWDKISNSWLDLIVQAPDDVLPSMTGYASVLNTGDIITSTYLNMELFLTKRETGNQLSVTNLNLAVAVENAIPFSQQLSFTPWNLETWSSFARLTASSSVSSTGNLLTQPQDLVTKWKASSAKGYLDARVSVSSSYVTATAAAPYVYVDPLSGQQIVTILVWDSDITDSLPATVSMDLLLDEMLRTNLREILFPAIYQLLATTLMDHIKAPLIPWSQSGDAPTNITFNKLLRLNDESWDRSTVVELDTGWDQFFNFGYYELNIDTSLREGLDKIQRSLSSLYNVGFYSLDRFTYPISILGGYLTTTGTLQLTTVSSSVAYMESWVDYEQLFSWSVMEFSHVFPSSTILSFNQHWTVNCQLSFPDSMSQPEVTIDSLSITAILENEHFLPFGCGIVPAVAHFENIDIGASVVAPQGLVTSSLGWSSSASLEATLLCLNTLYVPGFSLGPLILTASSTQDNSNINVVASTNEDAWSSLCLVHPSDVLEAFISLGTTLGSYTLVGGMKTEVPLTNHTLGSLIPWYKEYKTDILSWKTFQKLDDRNSPVLELKSDSWGDNNSTFYGLGWNGKMTLIINTEQFLLNITQIESNLTDPDWTLETVQSAIAAELARHRLSTSIEVLVESTTQKLLLRSLPSARVSRLGVRAYPYNTTTKTWTPGLSYCENRWEPESDLALQLLGVSNFAPEQWQELNRTIFAYDLNCPNRIATFLSRISFDTKNLTQFEGSNWAGAIQIPSSYHRSICEAIDDDCSDPKASILKQPFLSAAVYFTSKDKTGCTDMREFADQGLGGNSDVMTGQYQVSQCMYSSLTGSLELDPDLSTRLDYFSYAQRIFSDSAIIVPVTLVGPLFMPAAGEKILEGKEVPVFSSLNELMDVYSTVFLLSQPDTSIVYDATTDVLKFPLVYTPTLPPIVYNNVSLTNFLRQNTDPKTEIDGTAENITLQGYFTLLGTLALQLNPPQSSDIIDGLALNLPWPLKFTPKSSTEDFDQTLILSILAKKGTEEVFNGLVTISPVAPAVQCDYYNDEDCSDLPRFVTSLKMAFAETDLVRDVVSNKELPGACYIGWMPDITYVKIESPDGKFNANQLSIPESGWLGIAPSFIPFIENTTYSGNFLVSISGIKTKGLYSFTDWSQQSIDQSAPAQSRGDFAGHFYSLNNSTTRLVGG